MMNQIKLESIQQADLSQVVALASKVNLSVWRTDDYKEELDRKDSYLLAAKRFGIVIGFIAVRLTLADSNDKSICSEADIINIGVLKKYQKKGIGSLLLNEFLMNADKLKIKTVWLEVRESNTEAQNFYRLNGFVQVRKRINFYIQPPENALVMRLELADSLKISKLKT
jgi:ribosomal-protein-alanine N-acetyltransferase